MRLQLCHSGCVFCFWHKYMINIITVNTYQSFGVHLFSTLLVHVIYLYIYRKHAGTSQPSEVPVFLMIGFSTHTINQIKGSHALISTYFLTRKLVSSETLGSFPEPVPTPWVFTRSVFSRLQLARVPRGTWCHEQNDILMFRGTKDWFVLVG